jgi:hypothetical protein
MLSGTVNVSQVSMWVREDRCCIGGLVSALRYSNYVKRIKSISMQCSDFGVIKKGLVSGLYGVN